MKQLIIAFMTLVCVVSVFAYAVAYDEKKPPSISLPDACAMAKDALAGETNAFYCIGARLQISRSYDGEWLIHFSSTNGEHRTVFIFLDKKTKPQVFHADPPA